MFRFTYIHTHDTDTRVFISTCLLLNLISVITTRVKQFLIDDLHKNIANTTLFNSIKIRKMCFHALISHFFCLGIDKNYITRITVSYTQTTHYCTPRRGSDKVSPLTIFSIFNSYHERSRKLLKIRGHCFSSRNITFNLHYEQWTPVPV